MNAITGHLPLAMLVFAALSFFGFASAQETPVTGDASPAATDATVGLTLADVEAALAAIEADAGIADAVKPQLRAQYNKAIETLKEAADFAAKGSRYRESIRTAPVESAELRAELKALPSTEEAAKVTATGSTDDLQREVNSRKANLDELNDKLENITSALARVRERPFAISSRRPETQRELADIRQQLTSPRLAEGAESPGRVAERILLQAKQSRLASEAKMLEQEQLSQSAREDLLNAQQALLKRQGENAAAALETLESLLQERLASETKRVASLAEATPENVLESDEAVQALAAELQGLARELQDVLEKSKTVESVRDDLTTRLGRLTGRYQTTQEQLAVSGGGSGMAQILLDMARQFPNQLAYVDELTARVAPLAETRLASLEVRAKLRGQPDVESEFSGHPTAAVATLVSDRREVLEKLQTQYGNLTRELAALEGDKRQYLDKAKEVREYAGEQLFGFGMRSAPPIGVNTLTDISESLPWFFRKQHWVALSNALRESVQRSPVLSSAIVFFAALLLLARRRIGAALKQTGVKVRRVSTDRYAYTGEALLWTVLLALPIALLIGFTGWSLAQTPEPNAWLQGLAEGLQLIAWMAFVLAFLDAMCRDGGLGDDHFRWQDEPLARVRQAIRWFAVIYIPALLVTFSGVYEDQLDFLFTVGRVSFMLAHIWTAMVLWRLLNFSNGVFATFIRERPKSLIAGWRYLWFLLVLAFPLALVVIAGLGYVYTAIMLSLGLLCTVAYIVAGTILYRLARRWFRMKQRKIALAETLERRRARQEAAATPEREDAGEIVSVDREAEEELNLVTINEQTLELLRLVFSLGVAIAIFLLWSQSFPVIGALEAVAIPLTGGLTLLGVTKAVLIVVVTYIAVQNLPGLLELAVLRATSINAGTRNAISTLVQYGVFAFGLSLLLYVLNVDWAKLGWIAAALSVGIGFGLQEVVANFVCGLILLFERPIRVGDVITVNGVTGTVSKIRIRATTITNADRQDFLVPNKTLITGSLLNWTLKSEINRISIRLGVACESDPDRARQILLDEAAKHPLVLDEPKPMATFEAFGDSSHNLVLYAFLANVGSRLSVLTDLHTEIARRFAAAGIEIPNPQFDLHLRRDDDSTTSASSDALTRAQNNPSIAQAPPRTS